MRSGRTRERWRSLRRRSPWLAVGIAVAVVLIGLAGAGAVACKLTDLQCRPGGTFSLDELSGVGGGPLALPDDLELSVVAQGFGYPTAFALLPDGGVLVAEKEGLVHVFEKPGVLPKPFLDLRDAVSTTTSRGLVDIAVDPDFPQRSFVYAVYSTRGAGVKSTEPTAVRLSRFDVADGVADPASEKVLLGTAASLTESVSCPEQPRGADCLPSNVDHIGADIAFAPDGTLFVSTGDGGGAEDGQQQGLLAQDVDALGGKVLHVDREGMGLPGNPHWNGDPSANRSKVWATGLRNPFRIAVVGADPLVLAVGDVGWYAYDEVDLVERGDDLGWPCFEGPVPSRVYEKTDFCRAYAARGSGKRPVLALRNPEDGYSVIGGVSLESATSWPERYRDLYLFADWGVSRMYVADLSGASGFRLFSDNAGGPVDFEVTPDGEVYYLAANLAELRAIRGR